MTQLVWSPSFNNFLEILDDFSNVFYLEKFGDGIFKILDDWKIFDQGIVTK